MNIKKFKNCFRIKVKIFNQIKTFNIKFKYVNYIKNILSTLAVLSALDKIEDLKSNFFKGVTIPDGRGNISKIKFKEKKIFLIDESYNSNPLSLLSAISNFSNSDVQNNRKHFLMGDMLELGKHSKRLHKNMSTIINNSKISKIHIFGKDVSETYRGIQKNRRGRILRNETDIFNLIVKDLNNNDYLMIKGSNSTGLNRIVETLRGNI